MAPAGGGAPGGGRGGGPATSAPGRQKSTARAEATRRWPRHAEAFARARDDGRAESALIGLAGIMRERAGR